MIKLTWNQLSRQANEAGFGDDEYCCIATVTKQNPINTILNAPIWDDHTTRVACYAVQGGSEGWYTHVERQVGSERLLVILGKFWTLDRALEFAQWATRKVYLEG